MARWLNIIAIGLALLASYVVVVDDCDGANVWEAATIGVGGGGVWVDDGNAPGGRDVEAVARGALSLTPHVSIVGGAAYGVDRSYVRGSAGFRLAATDVNNPDFGVGVGVSRHFESEPGVGLDETAAEASIGWKPLPSQPVILTGLAAYGFDSGRRLFSLAVVFPFKRASGGGQ